MLTLKYLLMCGGFGMILVAVGILGFDLYEEALYRRALATPGAKRCLMLRSGGGGRRWL
jgi:hypothetical protein